MAKAYKCDMCGKYGDGVYYEMDLKTSDWSNEQNHFDLCDSCAELVKKYISKEAEPNEE